MVSRDLFARAQRFIPGGVNSPVRAFGAVGGVPPFIDKASGATVTDADGRRYVDYVGSWGPMILGHSHPPIVAAIRKAAGRGTSYGAPTAGEVEMAERIVAALPAVELIRMVSSGTEATMTAIRLARGFTGRRKVIKFIGCYHGHVDALLVKAGSGVATLGIPGSPGVPETLAQLTIALPYNDDAAAREAIQTHGDDLAGVIVEPVAGNMGVVPPAPGFLESLRELTAQSGSLLIFDEVITGFRVAYGGWQTLMGIRPDLTCLGKIIGGGLPVGALGGRRDIMACLAPDGPIYQAGTLSGNPLAMAAGKATLDLLKEASYAQLENQTRILCDGYRERFARRGLPLRINQVGSLFTLFFADGPVTDFATAARSDGKVFARFFHGMLDRGVYLPPSPFEAHFVSFAHGDREIEQTLAACDKTLAAL